MTEDSTIEDMSEKMNKCVDEHFRGRRNLLKKDIEKLREKITGLDFDPKTFNIMEK